MDKVKVSADALYVYLKEHDFIISVLGKYTGISNGTLTGCFNHDLNRHGKPLSFSKDNISKMNNSLGKISEDIRSCVLNFGSSLVYTNRRGSTYDPGLVEPIRENLGNFFKVSKLTERVLGWNRRKWAQTLTSRFSLIYGNITIEDVNRLNAELISVAGVLSNYEVVDDKVLETPVCEDNLNPNVEETDSWTTLMETNLTLEDLYHAFGEDRKVSASRLRRALERRNITTLKDSLRSQQVNY